MSKLLTAKQENFCQAIVDGSNQSDAYRYAYDASRMKAAVVANEASLLMQNHDISVRIAELRNQITAGKAWTFEQGMNQIETNIDLARRDKQHGAVRASTRDAIELSGLLDKPQGAADIKITKVTVILNHGNREDPENDMIEGVSRVLPSADGPE